MEVISTLLHELETASPFLTHALIEGIRKNRKCSVDEAIVEFANFQVTLKKLLKASQKGGGEPSS